MKKTIIFIFPLLITGCKFFQAQPLEEYLNEYTNTAAIVSHTFPIEYPKDSDGIINIPSAENQIISLLLRNPQKYRIISTPTLVDEKSQKIRSQIASESEFGDPYIFTQNSTDTSLAELSFSSEFLTQLDGGGDLSSILKLKGFTSDGVPLSFENNPYSDIIVRVNTPPEPVRNLIVLQDNTAAKYVIAFNMPDMSGIHSDIKKLIINGTEVSINTAINETGINTSSYSSFNINPSYYENLSAGENGISFSGATKPRCVFYNTNVPFQTTEYIAIVILEDKNGLQVESKVSTKSSQLKKVTKINESDILDTDDEGYGILQLKAPTQTTNSQSLSEKPEVYYIVYDSTNVIKNQGALTLDSNGIGKIKLASGQWKVETWSTLNGYINSETVEYSVNVKQKGISISVPTLGKYKLTYSGIGGPFVQDSDSIYKIIKNAETTKDSYVTVNTSIKDMSDQTITPTKVEYEIYVREALVGQGLNSIQISQYYEETYLLKTIFTVNDITYSETVVIIIMKQGS